MSRTSGLPKGWLADGSHLAEYEMGLAPGAGPAGAGAVYIKAGERPQGFATLMQQFKADAYRGKRLRFSATVRAEGIEQWTGLWMRVDGDTDQMLAFDNMQDRPITGTRDWERHAVVLDVPGQSSRVSFGMLLAGPGQVWMAEARVEAVGPDVSTTAARCVLPDHPVNLSFAE
jgi:hypothetical protein